MLCIVIRVTPSLSLGSSLPRTVVSRVMFSKKERNAVFESLSLTEPIFSERVSSSTSPPERAETSWDRLSSLLRLCTSSFSLL